MRLTRRGGRALAIGVIAVVGIGMLQALAGAAKKPRTERASVATNGEELPVDSRDPSISGNGRLVAFETPGAFSATDANGMYDVYVRNTATGNTARVSVTSDEGEVAAESYRPVISANGRFVAFQTSGDLAPGDGDGYLDIYVRDRELGTTTRVSVTSAGDEVAATSQGPRISASGRFVVFESEGVFTTGDAENDTDVFVHDRTEGTTERVSVMSNGLEVPGLAFSNPGGISKNGRFVAFDSFRPFTAGDEGEDSDVFVHDRTTGTTRRVSVRSNGSEVNDPFAARTALVSNSGRFVAFEGQGAFQASDTNGFSDVYVHDRKLRTTRRVSVRSNGRQVEDAGFLEGISGNGRLVAFVSSGRFGPGDEGTDNDVFVADRRTGKVRRISVKSNGREAESGDAPFAAIAQHGRFVAFESYGAYTGGDAGFDADIFVRGPLRRR